MTRVEADRTDLRLLLRALRDEADGKEMRRDLVRGLKVAVEPAAALARGSILAMGTKGAESAEPGLRSSVARAVKVSVRTGKNRPGVRVAVKKTSMPRGFRNAPKRLQSKKGWAHPTFGDWGKKVWQRGKPGWFDDNMIKAKPAADAAAQIALGNVARRISAKTRG